ncbi:MAG: phosphatidylserine/phosphatidylglycerophosphate/cardiolipin synthase family protein [Acidobacteriota bacterium]
MISQRAALREVKLSPIEWTLRALAQCLARAQEREDRLQELRAGLEETARSEEELSFPSSERHAMLNRLQYDRKRFARRLDFLHLGNKIRFGGRRSGGERKLEGALEEVFSAASTCELDALEDTLVFAIFGLPFTEQQFEENLRDDNALDELEHFYHAHRRELGSLEEVYRTLRPASSGDTLAYVDTLVDGLVWVSSVHEDENRDPEAPAWRYLSPEELRAYLETASSTRPGAAPGRARLSAAADVKRFFRMMAEPTRIAVYVHAKVEELEAVFRTAIPDRATDELFSETAKTLYGSAEALVRLESAMQESIQARVEVILDRWFRKEAVRALQKVLYDDPFASYWFFVQTGASPRPQHAYRGSRVTLDASVFDLRRLEGIGLAEATELWRENSIPYAFVDAHTELERRLTETRLSREEARQRIEASSLLNGAQRQKLQIHIQTPAENESVTTLDVYSWMLRDASRIGGRVDWNALRSGMEILLQAKRERVPSIVEDLVSAYSVDGEREALRHYLLIASELMLELELRQASARREDKHFRQKTGGGLAGLFLDRVMGGAVPGQLWVPGGVAGPEFREFLDEISPKNPVSGNLYHGKPATEIRLLRDGEAYYRGVVEAIDSSQDFIHVAQFSWKTDWGGKDIAYRLMAKKLGIEGASYEAFLQRFETGLPLRESAPLARFYDIPTGDMKNLLVFFSFMTSSEAEVAGARDQVVAALGHELECASVETCGDLSELFDRVGKPYEPQRRFEPGYEGAWEAFRRLGVVFGEQGQSPRPHRFLIEYVSGRDALHRFVRRFGRRSGSDPEQPFTIRIVKEGKNDTVSFPGLFKPMMDFDIQVLVWKGFVEYPWHVGSLRLPGRYVWKLPVPYVPFPWLQFVPGFQWAGPGMSLFLQHVLVRDPRTWWAMALHTKNVSTESVAVESGMGFATKYFNGYPDFRIWHDMAVWVEGPIVADVNDQFALMFNLARRNTKGIAGSRGVAVPEAEYPEPPESLSDASEPSWVITTEPERGDYNYRGILMAAVAAARQNILIEDPFFSDPLIAQMLVRKAREFRGRVSCGGLDDLECAEKKHDEVRIHLVLPAVSDQPIYDAVGTEYIHEMLHHGIKVWYWDATEGWSAQRMLHGKVFLIDYEPDVSGLSYVGSANTTQRSHASDNELGILSLSSDFAQEVCEDVFQRDVFHDSRRETAENFHVRRTSNPLVHSARFLRRMMVSLFWLF